MKAIGIILAGGKNERMGELTSKRASSALPVGGTYRAIDFPLSNMANSGLNKVAVITLYNSRSLQDHLSSSKWWDFGRKQGGLFVFSPFLSNEASMWFRGTADSMYQNISFLQRSNEPYVVIAPGESLYKMDFSDMIKYHIERQADITIAAKDMKGQDVRDYGVMQLEDDNRLTGFEEKPMEPEGSIASMGIYVISRALLIKLLETVISEGRYDFVKDIIVRFRKKLKIYAYMHDGYWTSINSIQSYYKANMDFLRKEVRDIFLKQPPFIESKPKDEAPAKYNSTATAVNTITGSGSIINGHVENSILFRKVVVGDNSRIINSIIMEGSVIGVNCVVENAILDKEVILSDGKSIIGTSGEPKIVGKNMLL